MAVTLKTIADECGVSRQTVSLALNDSPLLSAETKNRVISVAQQLGYRRSSISRMMRSGRFGSVALLRSTHLARGWLAEDLINHLHDELAKHDLHLIVVRLEDEELTEETTPRLLREWACDALLVNYIIDVPHYITELVESHCVPAIWLNLRRDTDCIYPDDYGLARCVTQRLVTLGHKRIDYLDVLHAGNHHYSVEERYRGYQDIMLEHDLLPRKMEIPFLPEARNLSHAKQWLQRDDRPTGVVCYGSGESAILTAACLSLGIKIPEDLSLVTFASAGDSLPVYFDTSFIYLPWREVAKQTVDMLLQKIENPSKNFTSKAVAGVAMQGSTIAPPPK